MATAVIRSGAHQFRVALGDVIQVEKLLGDPGAEVVFGEVLAVGETTLTFGEPLVQGAKVTGKIVSQDLGDKLVVFKFRRRKRYHRKNGHRQKYTSVQITGISS
jgi:large subunit ribosomal protein L21